MLHRPFQFIGFLAIVVVALAVVVSACQSPATPTAVAPTVAPAAPTAAEPSPTPRPKATGKMVIALTAEPEDMDPVQESSTTRPITRNILERLTDRDAKTMELTGLLAEKWEQTSPTAWRFQLRKSIRFHNGEKFNAEAAAWNINRAFDKELNSRLRIYLGPELKAQALDENTLEVVTESPDPMLPYRLYFVPIAAAKQAQNIPEELSNKPLGTGPYRHFEWSRGQFYRITANDEYWGPMPKIKDVTYVWRKESAVRASMVKTGEADMAFNISADDVKTVPKYVSHPTVETAMVRMDTENPALKDKRVRLAINLAIDKKSLVDRMYAGFADVARGQIINSLVVGYNPALQPYPYDPDQAKKLVGEAKAAGVPVDKELDYWLWKGWWPRDDEVAEAVASMLKEVGINAKLNIVEQARWRDVFYAVAPGQPRGALLQQAHGNEMGDSSQSTGLLLRCGGRAAMMCDKRLDEMDDKARIATGEERAKLYRDVWKYLNEEVVPVAPLFQLRFIYGLSQRLNWEPRVDGLVQIKEMSLSE